MREALKSVLRQKQDFLAKMRWPKRNGTIVENFTRFARK